MKSVTALEADTARQLRGVFMDIDDTLTDQGKLRPEAYEALWRLHDAGLEVVPVTGRPAGWCDLIIRQWPAKAVVGENGAFACIWDDGHVRQRLHSSLEAGDQTPSLDTIRDAVLREVPGSRVAKDQPYRLFDLAIDFCEEPPDLGLEAAEAIRGIFLAHGAHAKVSSIHVNGWFGDYDKVSMVQELAATWGVTDDVLASTYAFCGDSPNDEPMFEFFDHSVGVANIQRFIDTLEHPPTYVTEGKGGAGFTEFAEHLLQLRG